MVSSTLSFFFSLSFVVNLVLPFNECFLFFFFLSCRWLPILLSISFSSFSSITPLFSPPCGHGSFALALSRSFSHHQTPSLTHLCFSGLWEYFGKTLTFSKELKHLINGMF